MGKQGVTFYLESDVWKQLKQVSLDVDATVQDLMEKAVKLLLAKHGREASK